jgi:hypothetical protein
MKMKRRKVTAGILSVMTAAVLPKGWGGQPADPPELPIEQLSWEAEEKLFNEPIREWEEDVLDAKLEAFKELKKEQAGDPS